MQNIATVEDLDALSIDSLHTTESVRVQAAKVSTNSSAKQHVYSSLISVDESAVERLLPKASPVKKQVS